MSVEREMSLAEWCAKLPSQHVVNRELATLNKQLAALAEQNAQMRGTLDRHFKCECCCLHDGDMEALSLPDLATPVLNNIPKEQTLPVFDADSPRFRQVFDEAVQAHNLPGKRKGEGYRSPITQWCFEIAYSVVNRLRLYEK